MMKTLLLLTFCLLVIAPKQCDSQSTDFLGGLFGTVSNLLGWLLGSVLNLILPITYEFRYGYGVATGVKLPFYISKSQEEWVVIMQRFDGTLNFNRTWKEYQDGFGNQSGGEFWLGNERISQLTNTRGIKYCLHIEVQPKDSSKWYFADYDSFSVDTAANGYRLHLSGFNVKNATTNAGDSLVNTTGDPDFMLNGKNFTTYDTIADGCSQIYGSGWWYNDCYLGCLTCSYDTKFKWGSLYDLTDSGVTKLKVARLMMKRC